jgi:hypothetical protein
MATAARSARGSAMWGPQLLICLLLAVPCCRSGPAPFGPTPRPAPAPFAPAMADYRLSSAPAPGPAPAPFGPVMADYRPGQPTAFDYYPAGSEQVDHGLSYWVETSPKAEGLKGPEVNVQRYNGSKGLKSLKVSRVELFRSWLTYLLTYLLSNTYIYTRSTRHADDCHRGDVRTIQNL